ncbi:MAG: HWE histidine kinase domain-containing protein [Bauldia litoralis]
MSDKASGDGLPPGRAFLAGGGEMGALTRAYDWESSPLGAPEAWPQSLRTIVRLLLNTRHPMFIFWGPDLIQFYNDAYRQTMGPERHPSALGQRGRDCWEEIWDIIGPQIEYVMAGKGATWNEDQLVPVTRHGSREDVWWTYGYSPIDDENGQVGGVLVVCNDVTERILADQRRELLARELSHRVKNTLATVQAIASQTLQGDIGIEDARTAFTARLMALSRVQDILTGEPGAGAPLSKVVANALEHQGLDRFATNGPRVRLLPTAVTAMAMALHELSTNAAKYGALSTPDGRVSVEWGIRRPDDGEATFVLRWIETGGPPVTPPKRRGFGSRLIERGIAMELEGEATITYAPDGVTCVIEAPLSGLTG